MDFKLIFNELEKEFSEYNTFPKEDLTEQQFRAVCLSALVKSMEFNCFMQNMESNREHFFLSPFLRGLCEDLIVVSYLSRNIKADRDKLCYAFSQYSVFNGMKTQSEFFKREDPFKHFPCPNNVDAMIADVKERLSEIMTDNGLNKDRVFPSTEHMAIDAKLKHLYDFLYSATSRMVHFNPHVLMRAGWYKDDGPVNFSSYNFNSYYEQFNKFYSAYLFVRLSDVLKPMFSFSKKYQQKVKELKKELKKNFYPELVTFEELNLKRPNRILEILYKGLESEKGHKK
jgi:hypothetical protein